MDSHDTTAGDTTSRTNWYLRNGWWGKPGLVERFQSNLRAAPDWLSVCDDRGRSLSNTELWASAKTMRDALVDRGVEPGHVVLLVLPNWIEWQIAHLAIRMLGAIPANIPIRTDARVLGYVVELASVRCLIGADAFGSFDSGGALDGAASSVAHRVDVLRFSADGAARWSHNQATAPAVKPDDPRLDHLMFTSSTTGMPKAVMHSADGLNAFHETMASRFSLDTDGAIFMGSPLGHSVGAIHGARMSLYFGLPLVLQQVWNADAALGLIERHNCTFTAAATPFLKDLVEAPPQGGVPKLNSLRHFLCGGAQVPPGLMERADIEFPNTFVTVLWGMTEGGYTAAVPGVTDREKRYLTAGCASDGLELVVTAEGGRSVAPGIEGDLRMRGPAMFYGYLNQPELTDELFDDGFFFVGDRAVMDEDGYIRITGRSKDLIIRGGVNISPVPIEDALAGHPDVASVAVIGYPDGRLGERICAVFGPAGRRLNLDEAIAICAENGLAKHHWPEYVRHIDRMPTTAAGKIRKIDVRQWLANRIAEEGG